MECLCIYMSMHASYMGKKVAICRPVTVVKGKRQCKMEETT